MNAVLLINENDNVVTCLKPLTAGEMLELETRQLMVKDNVPSYHKLALFAIRKGDLCYKYGQVIGRATSDIEPGGHVHVHNLESLRGRGDIPGEEGRATDETNRFSSD